MNVSQHKRKAVFTLVTHGRFLRRQNSMVEFLTSDKNDRASPNVKTPKVVLNFENEALSGCQASVSA